MYFTRSDANCWIISTNVVIKCYKPTDTDWDDLKDNLREVMIWVYHGLPMLQVWVGLTFKHTSTMLLITYYLLKGQYNNIWSRYLVSWKNGTMTNANSTNETRLCSMSSTEMSKWSKQFCLCLVLHPNCPQTSAVSICNSHHGVYSTAQNFNAGLAMLVDCLVNWAQSVCYSLVNIQKTLENHECSCVNQRIKWPCSIANWNKWPEAKAS